MAYGLKYYTTFYDTLPANAGGPLQYTINIYENGYSGASNAFIAEGSPCQIVYKKQGLMSAIMASEMTLPLQATSANQYNEFKTAAPLQYYVEVLQNSNPFWFGVNTTDSYTQGHGPKPYSCRLRFNDGLGELQWHRYENNGALLAGQEQMVQVFNNCFTFLPYTLNLTEIINLREDTMSDSEGLLQQLYISDLSTTEQGDDGLTHGINCNKLLNNILTSMTCRIYQSAGSWWIERIPERTGTSPLSFTYTLNSAWQTSNAFAYSSTGSPSVVTDINNNPLTGFPRIIATSEDQTTIKNTSVVYALNVNAFNNLELIPNPFFEMNTPLDFWGNMPAFWDRSAQLIAEDSGNDQQLEIVDPWNADPRYQTAFSFGNAAATYQNTNAGEMGNVTLLPNDLATRAAQNSNISLHAVRRSGDAVTMPSVPMNGNTGNLSIDMQYFIKYRLTPNYASNKTAGEILIDANNIAEDTNCFQLFPIWKLSLYSHTNSSTAYMIGDSFSRTIPAYSIGAETCVVPASFYFAGLNDANGFFYATAYDGSGNVLASITYGTNSINRMGQANLRTLLQACVGVSGAYIDFAFTGGWNGDVPLTLGGTDSNGLSAGQALIECNDSQGHFQSAAATFIDTNTNISYGVIGVTPVDTYNFIIKISGVGANPPAVGHGFSSNSGNSGTMTSVTLSEVSANVASPDLVDFDFTHYPPWFNTADVNAYPIPGSTWNVQDFALIACDIQYKDNFTSAVSSQLFYSAADYDMRWSELTINAVYGDNVSASYPGAFRLSNFNETNTWHKIGGSHGFAFCDLICEDILPLVDTYRKSMTAVILGYTMFWNSIEDEDATLYIQNGAQFDLKQGMVRIDMQEMTVESAVINKTQLNNGIVAELNKGIHASPINRSAQSNILTEIGMAISAKITPNASVSPINSFVNG